MLSAEKFVRAAGCGLYTGVPCSYLKPLINYVLDSPDLRYVPAANEGDAVAIASGAALGGLPSLVMFQNSGLGNAVNPITSLSAIFRVPVLLVITWRGQPGGPEDEPQHQLMGRITPSMLETMGLSWSFFPETEEELEPTLAYARQTMKLTGLPFVLLMRRGAVAPHELQSQLPRRPLAEPGPQSRRAAELPSRAQVLRAVQAHLRPSDAVVATTGYMGRTLFGLEDRPSQLYMVGSMGCAASLGLGLALAQPQRRVVVLDGDGAALMRLGALTTLGYERPPNLLHLLLDNEAHASTGGQSTVTHSVDLAGVARSSGYPRVVSGGVHEVEQLLRKSPPELTFLHVKIASGEDESLPRPTVKPVEVARRFGTWLTQPQECLCP